MSRPGVASLMAGAGAVVIVVLAVYAVMQTSSMVSATTQVNLRATVSIGGPLGESVVNATYSNVGNGSAVLGPVTIPFVQIAGARFALGPAALVGNITGGGRELNVSASPANATRYCTPTLSLAKPTSHGFSVIDGVKPFGPSTITVVFAGTASWPATGLGLMLEPGVSSLFRIETNGAGNTTASVAYDNYSLTKGKVVGQFAQSSPFPFDTEAPSTMTLSLTGTGGVTVLVNGIPRLTHGIEEFTPFASSSAIWAPTNASVLGVVGQVGLTTDWVGVNATCGLLVTVPMVSDSSPAIALNNTPAGLAGPLSEPTLPSGSLYVLELLDIRAGMAPAAAVTNGTPFSLGSNGVLTFSAPFGV